MTNATTLTGVETFTVTDPSNGVRGRGLTAVEAAQEILGHDGHDYELLDAAGGFQLFVSRGSSNSFAGNGGLTAALINGGSVRSIAPSAAEAWAEIAPRILSASWNRLQVVTDTEYDEMIADLASENAE